MTIAAFANFPIVGGYSAFKSALFSLSQGIRIELASKGIAVHTVNPGPVDTELAKEFPTVKVSPTLAAEDILTCMENDEADIFPDEFGQQMFEIWRRWCSTCITLPDHNTSVFLTVLAAGKTGLPNLRPKEQRQRQCP